MKLFCAFGVAFSCFVANELSVVGAVELRRTVRTTPAQNASTLALNLTPQDSVGAPDAALSLQMSNTTAHVQHRARLDVGFGDFEHNLTVWINASVGETVSGAGWSKELRERLLSNVTRTLSGGLKGMLAPLKQSIGKTWMALPRDEQKNEYVQQVRSAFASVFKKSMESTQKHFQLSLRRLSRMKDMSSPNATLSLGESTVDGSLLNEHCYEEGATATHSKHSVVNGTHTANSSHSKHSVVNGTRTANSSVVDGTHKFCVPSLLRSLVNRLNDTQGLISMTMRFETGAMMSLAQQAQRPA